MKKFLPKQTLLPFFIFFSLLCFMHIYPQNAYAQEQKTPKQIADNYFYRESYIRAVPYYLSMSNRRNPKMDILLKLAYSYKQMNDYEEAEKWYSKAYALYPKKMPVNAYKEYGEILQNNKKFDEARLLFETYMEKSKADNSLCLASLDSTIKWNNNPDKSLIVKNATELNSLQGDWGAIYGKRGIVFVSNRNSNMVDERSGENLNKIFLCSYSDNKITPYSFEINENKYHVGPICASKNLDTMYFTRTNVKSSNLNFISTLFKEKLRVREVEIFYRIKKDNNQWTQSIPFAYNNPKEYSVAHPALSADGNILYFASDMKGGYGETDIYYCRKNANGTWDNPINCGPDINTSGKETFPTIVMENGIEYLYFSTNGRPSLGGLDIYKALGKKDNWQKPINAGIPINSSRDDYYYVSNDGGNSGYLSSNRVGGKGSDDIYAFFRMQDTEKEKITDYSKQLITLEGLVIDKDTKAVIEEDFMVNLINNSTKEELICVRANTSKNKKYVFEIIRGQSYTIKATAKNYIPVENESFTSNIDDKNHTYYKDIELAKVGSPSGIVDRVNFILKNIYYDLDKYNIRPDAALELDKVAEILQQNPTMKIELSSHTDCRASNAYNMRLSEKRAKSAVQYLISHGIEASRLKAKGYGETQLVNECADGVKCTESQHQENRRTEIKLFR